MFSSTRARALRAMRMAAAAALIAGCKGSSDAGSGDGAGAAPPESGPAGAGASSRFAFDLHRRLAEQPGNLVFSPYGIHVALRMAAAGAAGRTAAQMSQALALDAAAETLTLASRGPDAPELSIANALWLQSGFAFRPSYLERVGRVGATLEHADFRAAPERAREAINAWVSQRTHERIRDLVPSSALDANTRLVITNAIYLKANWVHTFAKDATRPLPFRRAAGGPVDVPTMTQTASFPYLKEADHAVLVLPYRESGLAMILALPDRDDGLVALERSIGPEVVRRWMNAPNGSVEVQLPRFEFASDLALRSTLEALGMTDAFDPERADFSAMTDAERLFVSAALHKAYVRVDEEGTVAAAATGVLMGITSAIVNPTPFHADHPFLFLIADRASGVVLFMGRVVDPSR